LCFLSDAEAIKFSYSLLFSAAFMAERNRGCMSSLLNKNPICGECVGSILLIMGIINPAIESGFFYSHVTKHLNHFLGLICYLV